jgi:hypothetical protein
MAHEVHAMVACRAPDGLSFGTMRLADAGEISLEIEAEIPLDCDIAWQVEIPGVDDAVLGNARVRSSGRNPRTGIRSYRASVTWVAEEDRELWNAWLGAVTRGSRGFSHARITSERMEDWKAAVRSSLDPADKPRQDRLRAEKLEARPARIRALADLDAHASAADQVTATPARGLAAATAPVRSVHTTSSFSLGGGGFSEVGGRPRDAMAAALRDRLGAMGKMARAAGPPLVASAPTPAPGPAAAAASSQAPVTPGASPAPPSPAARPDPSVATDATGFVVAWQSVSAYARDYARDLRASALRLQVPSPFSAGRRVTVRLELPSGLVLAATAEVVAATGGQTGLYLQLDRQARATLAAEHPPPGGAGGRPA